MLAPTGVPKIADFGLAKQTQESTVLTVHDTMIGTVPYMSPEHATGQHVDERSDIFSLGVVAYEIFGGRRPFPGSSSASVINAIVTLEPPALTNLNPLVTDDLHRVVSKMLQKDPAKRYQSADAVRRDLEVVVDQWGVTRANTLIAEYIANPEGVRASLTARRFKEHLNRGLQFKSMGLGKIDDAIREFERAHYLAPDNEEVSRHLEKLRAERPGRDQRDSKASGAARPLRFRLPTGWMRVGIPAGIAAMLLGTGVWYLERESGKVPPPLVKTLAATQARPAILTGAPAASAPEPRRHERADDAEKTEVTARASAPEAGDGEETGKKATAGAAAAVPERAPEPRAETSRADAPGIPSRETAPVPANGSLEINAKPSATFIVNERVIAENVAAVSLLFPPGTYDIRLENPYYGTKTWSGINVVSNETKTLVHDFTKEATGSFLTVTTNRIPAMIWIDDAPTERWTPQRRITIAPGLHRITVRKDGFIVEEGVVDAAVRDGATVELSFTLREISPR
jgi:hypothetical protein